MYLIELDPPRDHLQTKIIDDVLGRVDKTWEGAGG